MQQMEILNVHCRLSAISKQMFFQSKLNVYFQLGLRHRLSDGLPYSIPKLMNVVCAETMLWHSVCSSLQAH